MNHFGTHKYSRNPIILHTHDRRQSRMITNAGGCEQREKKETSRKVRCTRNIENHNYRVHQGIFSVLSLLRLVG